MMQKKSYWKKRMMWVLLIDTVQPNANIYFQCFIAIPNPLNNYQLVLLNDNVQCFMSISLQFLFIHYISEYFIMFLDL